MEDFFVIGSGDPTFILTCKLCWEPGFQGIVRAEANPVNNRYLQPSVQADAGRLKTVSLGSFLLHAKKHPGVGLVSCYDLPSGRRFAKKLAETMQGNCVLDDYYTFFLERNMPLMFLPTQEERTIILGAKREWAEFRNHLTDDFSKFSLDCYLSAYEKKDPSLLFPVYVGFDNTYFNRTSRKVSIVPGPDEKYVDVGACDGDTVTGFVDRAGTYRSIHAYEPVKSSFETLEKRGFYLENFFAKNVAASNKNGSIDFIMESHATSARPVDGRPIDNKVVETVPCVRLDDELDDVTLLKIEVEGHEASVIEGAANLIRTCKPDIVTQAYHYPLDPLRILEAVNKAHEYEHIALRFNTVGLHHFSMLFSDRAPFL